MSWPRVAAGPSASARNPWARVRLHIVSGKGGAGKTTVAAALAVALAEGGGRVLLVEVEERQGLAPIFGIEPLSYEEREIAIAPGDGQVLGMSVDPHEALMEYLSLYYKMRRAGKTLERIGAVDFATSVAPGLRDVLLTGKVFEAVRRRSADGTSNEFAYDAVVVDAPPTGRIIDFLGVSTDVAGLAKVGPINRQAEAITTLFRSPRAVVHLVTLLDALAAQETIEAVEALRAGHFPVGAVIINATSPPMLRQEEIVALRDGELDTAAVAKELASAGIYDDAEAEVLMREGADYVARVRTERRNRRTLQRIGRPIVDLPRLKGGVDASAVQELAGVLRDQGMS